ncbi:MAG: MFS transporter [Ruminococcaceae bacterium]|nr:MFS transporter [Oscillospiraceae bacterium]
MFADRYNPERMIKIGLLGSAVANLIIFFNQNFYVMLFTWMFNAAIQFAIWPSVFKITASQLPRSEKSKNVFFISFSPTMGLLLSFIVAGILPAWQLNFAVSSAVSLVLFILMHFICKKVDRFMLPDRETLLENIKERDDKGISLMTLMISSGLLLIIAVNLIRTMIGQGAQTLAPTMLMESYDGISASFGNILNIIVIISGIFGVFSSRFLIKRRIIKNEIVGMAGTLLIMIPMCVIICLIGKIPSILVIVSMSVISFCATAASFLTSSYSSQFAAFGKDGTVAGLINCSGSAALIVQTYGFSAVADNFGWVAVSKLWVVLTTVAVVMSIAAIPIFNKFRKKHREVM